MPQQEFIKAKTTFSKDGRVDTELITKNENIISRAESLGFSILEYLNIVRESAISYLEANNLQGLGVLQANQFVLAVGLEYVKQYNQNKKRYTNSKSSDNHISAAVRTAIKYSVGVGATLVSLYALESAGENAPYIIVTAPLATGVIRSFSFQFGNRLISNVVGSMAASSLDLPLDASESLIRERMQSQNTFAQDQQNNIGEFIHKKTFYNFEDTSNWGKDDFKDYTQPINGAVKVGDKYIVEGLSEEQVATAYNIPIENVIENDNFDLLGKVSVSKLFT